MKYEITFRFNDGAKCTCEAYATQTHSAEESAFDCIVRFINEGGQPVSILRAREDDATSNEGKTKVTVNRSCSGETYTVSSKARNIQLTADEVAAVREYGRIESLRETVENAVEWCEDDGAVSFDTWETCPCGNYSSANAARNAFIDDVKESIIEKDNLYDRLPMHSDDEIYNAVIDAASDYEFLKE